MDLAKLHRELKRCQVAQNSGKIPDIGLVHKVSKEGEHLPHC